ncbi:MAG: hypothetical protein PHN51_04005 [Candidatus Nanopelagicales bacterium]|nr:hypothetical protein [Candidatus Nanopelagicales bacterium]
MSNNWTLGITDKPEEVVWNEFAAVRVAIDRAGKTPRLMIEDLETHEVAYLDPLELASFVIATPEMRTEWLAVGAYAKAQLRGEPHPH